MKRAVQQQRLSKKKRPSQKRTKALESWPIVDEVEEPPPIPDASEDDIKKIWLTLQNTAAFLSYHHAPFAVGISEFSFVLCNWNRVANLLSGSQKSEHYKIKPDPNLVEKAALKLGLSRSDV